MSLKDNFTAKVYRFLFLVLIFSAPTNPIRAAVFASSRPINCNKMFNQDPQFNKRFLEFMQTWQIPGASVTVMKDHKIAFSCGYGWANLEERQPMRADSLFRLGSISKTLTSIAILKLIEQNKLHLNDKVFTLLSHLKPLNKAKVADKIDTITLQNLLQMSSGWYSDRPEDYDPLFGPWSNNMLKQLNYQVPPDCETAARLMMSVPLEFTPGTQFSYSNLSFCLLGLVINKSINQKGYQGYESYIKQSILAPLGIHDMILGSTKIENKAPNEVKYYATNINVFNDIDRTLDGLPYSSTEILQKNYADGGWIASSLDLVKLMNALFSNQILDAKIKKIMFEPPHYSELNSGYPAMGWDVVKIIDGKRYISKIGSFTGTIAFILQVDDGNSYAVLFNTKPKDDTHFIEELEKLLV